MTRTRQTVVVVDDDDSVRRSLQRLIRSVGLDVEAFASAEDFLQSDRRAAPGCLLLDLQLPGMSGLELQERLLSEGRAIPVVFITAFGDDRSRELAARAGAVAFLQKPFEEKDLLDAVARTLGAAPADGPMAGGGLSTGN
jgi:FixJ family two-component response regulator